MWPRAALCSFIKLFDFPCNYTSAFIVPNFGLFLVPQYDFYQAQQASVFLSLWAGLFLYEHLRNGFIALIKGMGKLES